MYDNTTDVNNWFADKAERKRYEYDLNDKSVVMTLVDITVNLQNVYQQPMVVECVYSNLLPNSLIYV